jgi:hypothetical protein
VKNIVFLCLLICSVAKADDLSFLGIQTGESEAQVVLTLSNQGYLLKCGEDKKEKESETCAAISRDSSQIPHVINEIKFHKDVMYTLAFTFPSSSRRYLIQSISALNGPAKAGAGGSIKWDNGLPTGQNEFIGIVYEDDPKDSTLVWVNLRRSLAK